MLAVSWQKLEFESWPVLLDEVQHQYDINAGKVYYGFLLFYIFEVEGILIYGSLDILEGWGNRYDNKMA